MHRQLRVAVIIPAYNEARLIGKTLRGIPEYVDAIFVVDDHSQDETVQRATFLSDQRTTVVEHTENRGVGAAICTGYRAALADDCQALAVMAGDNQMDPDDLSGLLDALIDERADYVKGNRFRHPEFRRMPIHRRLAGSWLAWVTRVMTGLDIDDSQCGYTVLHGSAAARLQLDDLWPRFGYPNDLLGMLSAAKMKVVEVPVRPIYDDEQSGVRAWHAALIVGLIGRRWWRNRTSAV